MFKKVSYIFIVIVLFTIQCTIIDFGERGTNILVHISQLFQVSENTSSYAKMGIIKIQDEYNLAGVNPQDVLNVRLSNVQIIIERNGTGAATESDGEIWFQLQAPGQTQYKLASFPMINVNSILNIPMNPFAAGAANLTLDPDGVEYLKQLLQQIQAPTLVFFFRGNVNSPPIDFDARLIVDLIVKVKVT